jgi:type IV secretory pathway VirB2 component (pilin)
MEALLARPTVIALALTGGVLSALAMFLRKREGNLARRMDVAGYVFMGISMLLFVIAGFRGQA